MLDQHQHLINLLNRPMELLHRPPPPQLQTLTQSLPIPDLERGCEIESWCARSHRCWPQAQAEIVIATNMGTLSADMQMVFKSYFDRYDVNGSGKLDSSKELTQMVCCWGCSAVSVRRCLQVTNLAFALKLGAGLTKLLEEVTSRTASMLFVRHVAFQVEAVHSPDWNVDQFVEWFLQVLKRLPSLKA